MKAKQVLGVVVMSVLIAACGSQSEKETERVLTLDEASVLSQVSFNHYDKGGATFEVNTVTEPGGPQLRLVGKIDWKTHTGSADLQTSVPSATLTRVWWKDDGVLEERPQLNNTITSITSVESPILLRRPNKEKRLDQVLSIITGLASEQPENAQLILQKQGSAYLRRDELRGEQVDVMRYGERSIFWISVESQQCLRFEGANKLGNQPIIIDFSAHGLQKIQSPPPERWVIAEGNEQLLSLTNGW